MTDPAAGGLLDALFSTDAIRSILDDRARLQGMLDFEAALAAAEAEVGLIPHEAATIIARHCDAALFDMAALSRGAALGGNVAIPMVKALTALVADSDAAASRYVHWGATSQDAIDTGLVLQLRRVLDVVDADLARFAVALRRRCVEHRGTTLVGRTWLQQATPVTLGLKLGGWLSAVQRHRRRLRELRVRVCVVQLGGAAGTLAAIGPRGIDVMDALARALHLGSPDLPWHTHRDRVAEVATCLGLLTGSLGKMARDVSLLMQTEVGEVFEPSAAGKGGSSTMPHKRNPVGCAAVLGAAMRVPALVSTMLHAMVQEHERGMGNWHAEWETLPEIASLTAGALAQMNQIVDGFEVDADRMATNLAMTGGLILTEAVTMALGAKVGRLAAHQLVEHASRRAVETGLPLRDVLLADAVVAQHLAPQDVDRLLDPTRYTGAVGRPRRPRGRRVARLTRPDQAAIAAAAARSPSR